MINAGDVKYFTRKNKREKCEEITVIYLDIGDDKVASKKSEKQLTCSSEL